MVVGINTFTPTSQGKRMNWYFIIFIIKMAGHHPASTFTLFVTPLIEGACSGSYSH
jgi:hypothetical protein